MTDPKTFVEVKPNTCALNSSLIKEKSSQEENKKTPSSFCRNSHTSHVCNTGRCCISL